LYGASWDDQCTSNRSRLIIITGKAPTYKERMEIIKGRILLYETQSSYYLEHHKWVSQFVSERMNERLNNLVNELILCELTPKRFCVETND